MTKLVSSRRGFKKISPSGCYAIRRTYFFQQQLVAMRHPPVPKTPKIGDFWGCFARWSPPFPLRGGGATHEVGGQPRAPDCLATGAPTKPQKSEIFGAASQEGGGCPPAATNFVGRWVGRPITFGTGGALHSPGKNDGRLPASFHYLLACTGGKGSTAL